ncbi:MAG: hypothetical protein KGM49_03525 [Sphingomonadales bacterium]|nr:hypothetical protein [Sphingomonadales bacterium]
MPFPLVLLPLLAQVGPTGTQMQAPLELPKRRPVTSVIRSVSPALRQASRLGDCLAQARTEPAAAVATANAWRNSANGPARAEAEQCLGMALSGQNQWSGAEQAFLSARDDSLASDKLSRARFGAMAANAALATNASERALSLLDAAHGDALGGGDTHLAAEVAIDRARALVILKRDSDAVASLAEATNGAPEIGTGWLLSATLARRHGRLAEAQAAIEHAATLQPLDPETGLEAGVIAVLSGHDEAARKSWQSVVASAPDSDSAKIARQYLDQLGPAAAPSSR